MPNIYWVDGAGIGRLAIVQRPRIATDYMALKEAGIDVLVSMLEREEAHRAGLSSAPHYCRDAGIAFHSQPITDFGLPTTIEPMEMLARHLLAELRAGKGVAAHCYAGLGRSPLMIATVLVEAGLDASEACGLLSEARGENVPEMPTQVRWLENYQQRRERG